MSKFSQKVGLDNVNIEYSRPSARQRIVFGTLIPFGEKWRTGANENTKITQMIIYDCGICFENSNIKLSTDFWFALINYDIDKLIIVLTTLNLLGSVQFPFVIHSNFVHK